MDNHLNAYIKQEAEKIKSIIDGLLARGYNHIAEKHLDGERELGQMRLFNLKVEQFINKLFK